MWPDSGFANLPGMAVAEMGSCSVMEQCPSLDSASHMPGWHFSIRVLCLSPITQINALHNLHSSVWQSNWEIFGDSVIRPRNSNTSAMIGDQWSHSYDSVLHWGSNLRPCSCRACAPILSQVLHWAMISEELEISVHKSTEQGNWHFPGCPGYARVQNMLTGLLQRSCRVQIALAPKLDSLHSSSNPCFFYLPQVPLSDLPTVTVEIIKFQAPSFLWISLPSPLAWHRGGLGTVTDVYGNTLEASLCGSPLPARQKFPPLCLWRNYLFILIV